MANKRGQLNCTENSKNVGFGSCFEDWKIIKGAFLFDNPRSFTDEQIAALQASLEAAAAADSKAARMFPIHDFRVATDNTEDVVVQTFDYGSKTIVRDGDNDWSFQFVDGGNCLNTALRTHNGKRYALFYDKDNKILGYRKDSQLAAIPLQFFYAKPWALATGSTAAAYMVRFVFESKYVNELREFVKADFDLSEIVGLQDVEIVLNSFDQNTGVANVTLQTACGAVNIFDTYNADIDETLFSAIDEDGNDVEVATVAPVTGSKSFDITLTVGDLPDSGIVTLSGAAPSVLLAAGIDGYEFTDLELTVEGS